MRRNHGQCPPLLPQLRSQALNPFSPLVSLWWLAVRGRLLSKIVLPCLGLLLLVAGVTGPLVPGAMAAEILSVRQPTLLRIGDQNRSYLVQLACLAVPDNQSERAMDWLRHHGARGTRVNIRPVTQTDGILVAKVSLLKTGVDLGEALVASGLATPSPCPSDGVEG